VTSPTETDPAHVQREIEFQLYGAITAAKAVLPGMWEAGAGTPSLHPRRRLGRPPAPSSLAAQGALRSGEMSL
jgi:hypothetical protein